MGLEIYPNPSVFTSLSVNNLVGSVANITNVFLTSVNTLSVTNGTVLADRFIASQLIYTPILTSQNLTATNIFVNSNGNLLNLQSVSASLFVTPNGNSNTWNNIATVVQSNSASWEDVNEIIPTTANYLSTNNIILSSTKINGPIITNFIVETNTLPSYSFTDNDNSKVFHFDTNTQPQITAIFANENLTNGFNVGIINTGLGVIYLSSNFVPTINATNTFNSVRQSGMFIYKTNNQLFGVGVFE